MNNKELQVANVEVPQKSNTIAMETADAANAIAVVVPSVIAFAASDKDL